MKKIISCLLMVFCIFLVGCSSNSTDKATDKAIEACKNNNWTYEPVKLRLTNVPDTEYSGLHIQADGYNFEFYECESKEDAQKLYDNFTSDAIAYPYVKINKNTVIAYKAIVIYGKSEERTEEEDAQINEILDRLEV